MPYYDFKCAAGHEFEENVSIERRNESQKCPHCSKKAMKAFKPAIMIADPFSIGRVKPPQDFQERMKQIKDDHPGSTIRTDW